MGKSYLDELKNNVEKERNKAINNIDTSSKEKTKEDQNNSKTIINDNNKQDNQEQENNKSSFEKLDTLKKMFGSKRENKDDVASKATNKIIDQEIKDTKSNADQDRDQGQDQKKKPKSITLNLKEEDVNEDEDFKKHVEKSFKNTKDNLFDIQKLKSRNEDKDNKEKNWEERAHLITKYDDVEIYRLDDELLLQYRVPTPKPTASQKLIINTLKEAATRLISTDPYKIRDPLQRKNLYYQKIIDILENAPEINIPKHMHDFYAKAVVKEMVGYGILEPLLQDDKLEEIMVLGPNKPTYVYHVDYGMMFTNIIFYSNDQIYEIIDKIARTLGRRVDISKPLLDARLPDGSRVNATVPPASIDGDTITIRKFKKDPYTIIDLINFGTLNLEVASFLWCIVEGFNGAKPANIIISGGTSSGKTTTLNVLANFIPESDRILTIEDTAELRLPIKHVIRFEGKPPGLEGKGELSLDILVKNTLRMRPDRIIVGEIRHKEALSLFTAMNTGHDGCMGTIHSNSARETLVRITSPPMEVPMLMLAGLDFIVVQKRLKTTKGMVRRIVSIAEITGVLDNKPQANIIFKWNPESDQLERTKEPIQYFEIIKSFTKLDDEGIKSKLEERIKFLKTLINKNIRDIESVSDNIQDIYIKLRKKY